MNWFSQSVFAMLLAVPVYILIGFFGNYHGTKPEIILGWYFLGVAATALFFGGKASTIIPSWGVVSAILLLGITIGGGRPIYSISELLLMRVRPTRDCL